MRPAAAQSLGDLCALAAAQWPERTALHFDASGEGPAQSLSFTQLHARSSQLAHALVALGVRPGDRVAVLAANRPVFPLAWLAIAKAGACMVPVNPAYRDADALHLLVHAEVRLAIADNERAELLRRLRPQARCLQTVLVDAPGNALQDGELNLQAVAQAHPDAPLGLWVAPEALANVQFTSGTTGLPKGCMLSHRYWTQLGRMIADDLVGLGPQDVMLTAQPFSYIDPQWNVAAMLASGATLVVLQPLPLLAQGGGPPGHILLLLGRHASNDAGPAHQCGRASAPPSCGDVLGHPGRAPRRTRNPFWCALA